MISRALLAAVALLAASCVVEYIDECEGDEPALLCASSFCPEDPEHPVCDACEADPECRSLVCAPGYGEENPICDSYEMDAGASEEGGVVGDADSSNNPVPDGAPGCSGLGCGCNASTPCAEGVCSEGICVICTADGAGCSGDTPVCDTEAGACVACTEHADCTDPTRSRCDPSGQCVGCSISTQCTHLSDTPICSPNQEICVPCLGDQDDVCGAGVCIVGGTSCVDCNVDGDCASGVCSDGGNTCVECNETSDCGSGVCITGGNSCVECNADADCGELAPRCNTSTNTCETCTSDPDCSRFGKVCDEVSAQCVQCTVDTEESQCGEELEFRACDPQAFTCSGAVRDSLGLCRECISDSECVAGTLCVPTSFQSASHGNYCLPQIGAGLCPNQVRIKRESTSVFGVTDNICFPNDVLATCEAVGDFAIACDDDVDCGADGLDDGLCRDNRCTYACDSRVDCSGSTDMVNKCVGFPSYCDPN